MWLDARQALIAAVCALSWAVRTCRWRRCTTSQFGSLVRFRALRPTCTRWGTGGQSCCPTPATSLCRFWPALGPHAHASALPLVQGQSVEREPAGPHCPSASPAGGMRANHQHAVWFQCHGGARSVCQGAASRCTTHAARCASACHGAFQRRCASKPRRSCRSRRTTCRD